MKKFKKNIIYISLFLLCFSLIGCSKEKGTLKDNSKKETNNESVDNRNVDINLDIDESEEESIELNNNSNKDLKIIFNDNEYDCGNVKLGNYKGLKHNVEKTEISEFDKNALLDGLYNSVATTRYVTSGVASRGDTVNISFVATDENGNEVDRSSDNGLKLTLGDQAYYEGLDDGIYGLEVGESFSYPIDYKEDILVENRNIRNKIITFDVTLNGIYMRDNSNDLQIGTDEFVDTLLYSTTNCRTVTELEEYVEKQLEDDVLKQYNDSVSNILLTQLFKSSEITNYPEDLVEAYYNDFWDKCINNAREQNITIDSYLELTKQSYSTLDNKFQEKALNCAKADVILINIAKRENLNTTQEALQYIIDNSVYDKDSYTSNLKEFYDYQYIYF